MADAPAKASPETTARMVAKATADRSRPIGRTSSLGEAVARPSRLCRAARDEGHSYQAIKDDLRRDLAINYLSRSRSSVMDVALALGFAEPSAFHRAFKKWTGANPGEYRQSSQRRSEARADLAG